MLKWAIIFAVSRPGRRDVRVHRHRRGRCRIAKILFVVFLVLFVAVLLFALLGAKAVSSK
jgi:uncharacterized membrane protein YtjA (UPF0391 family)